MANIRQTILVRTDLGFSTGLMAAQCSHIHMQAFRLAINSIQFKSVALPEAMTPKMVGELTLPTDALEWLKSPYVFIHGVPNKEVLEHFVHKARNAGIITETWKDCVFIDISDTQREAFGDVLVGCSLGPCDSDKIKSVIGDLPLLTK